MFTAGWVSGRRPRMGRRARAWALSTAGLSAVPDQGGHPRLGGGRSLLGWRGPAVVCTAMSLLIPTQDHVNKGQHNDSIIVVVCRRQQGLRSRDVQQHQEEEGGAREVVAADRGVHPSPVSVVGGNRGHVRHGGGERKWRLRGGIDVASGQIELASLEGGAGRSKGGGNGDNNDAHSDDAIGGGNMGRHLAVDPPQAEMGDGGGGGMTMTTTAGGTARR
jgi:hypothetical protein